MEKTREKRIFLGPNEISGFSCNLSDGLKQIGENVKFIDLWDHAYGYGGSDNGKLESLLRIFKKSYYRNTKRQPVKKLLFGLLNSFFTFIHFIKAIFIYDVFIFIFGVSLLPNNMDLMILRLFRKKVIFNIALGSEARPPYMNGVYQKKDGSENFDLRTIYRLTKKIKKRVNRIEKWSSLVIGSPFSTSQFSAKKFINYFSLGFPRKGISVTGTIGTESKSAGICRILHSPSHPAAKGTELIKEAVENLRQKGYKLDFILLKNKSNKEVLEELSRCDFIVDQLYSDTPLAGFACEAAAFGKPAIVGSYAVEQFGNYITDEMMPPSLLCSPGNVQESIELMINDEKLREKIGAEAKTFIEDQWSSESVAKRYSFLVNGNVPEEFWINPVDIDYLYGAGQSEEKTQKIISELIDEYGSSSLCLDHKYGLKTKVLEFAGEPVD